MRSILLVATLLASLLTPLAGVAQAAYTTQAGWTFELPVDPMGASGFTAATSFPSATRGYVHGYPLAGRILALSGRSLFLQRAFGSSDFAVVARLPVDADPSFVRVSTDGQQVAVGVGYGKPLYVLPTKALDMQEPPELDEHTDVMAFDVSYYDAAWRDGRYLVLNAGWFAGSGLFVLDTFAGPHAAPWPLMEDIAGASAGITFDRDGNLITGVGYDATRTGELRIVPADVLASAFEMMGAVSYEDDALLLAHNLLSAGHLAVDRSGNLFVGGGDVFGPTGDFGSAAVVSASVVSRVMTGGAPLDPDAEDELQRLQPDPCGNDDAVSTLYIEAVDMVLVSANMASPADACEAYDWSPGLPVHHAHLPPEPQDLNMNGVPDGLDPDFGAREFLDRAYFSRFVDAFGGISGDAGFDAGFDLNDDGSIDFGDLATVQARWGDPRWR